jgi:hypothetical protein
MGVEIAATFYTAAVLRRFVGLEFCRKENRSGDNSPERGRKPSIAALTNAGPQDTSVIVQANLTAGKEVSNGCHRFPAAVRAGTDCQNQIAKR